MDTIEVITQTQVVEVVTAGPQGLKGDKGDPGDVGGSIPWENVTDKPSTFAPTAHASSHASAGDDPLSPADIGAASAAQGALADSAVQPGDLGTAAAAATTDFATASHNHSHNALSGLQGGATGAYYHLPAGTADNQVATWDEATGTWAGEAPAAHEHVAADITDFAASVEAVSPPADWDTLANKPTLAAVATSGSYNDLSNKPTLGTASAAATTDFDASGTAASAVSTHAGKTDGSAHSISGISGLADALAGKQAAGSYVPTSRTINSKALSADITLSASDVGAAASSHTHDAADLTSGTIADARLSANVALEDASNTFTQNQTFDGTNNVAPNQTAASGSSVMTRDLVDARSGRVLFYRVSSALSATSTAKVFDSTTLTIPAGTYEVQAHGRATYNGSNGGWSFGVERASGNSGTATALIFQHVGESGIFNNLGGAYRASPTFNLFGGNAILAAVGGATSLHRTGQVAASGLLVVTSELVVVWYVAQVATDASNATTLDANSFLMLTKVA